MDKTLTWPLMAAPQRITLAGERQAIHLAWDWEPDSDMTAVEIWGQPSQPVDGSPPPRHLLGYVHRPRFVIPARGTFVHVGLGAGDTWQYWLRSVHRTGVVSPFTPEDLTHGFQASTIDVQEESPLLAP